MRYLPCLFLVFFTFNAAAQSPSPASDPRVLLVELQIDGRSEEALEAVERIVRENPEAARGYGLDYLRGRLLLEIGRPQEALEALAATLRSTPDLEPYSRYHLALQQERRGAPLVAAGLVATLLGDGAPRSLTPRAMRLLRRSIADGGDCRLLTHLLQGSFRSGERRQLGWMKGECARREGRPEEAMREWLKLLESKRGDQTARLAAESLAALHVAIEHETNDAREHRLLGLTFHDHREFVQAIHHLVRATLPQAGKTGGHSSSPFTRTENFELRYALARSHFWLGNYQAAIDAFAGLEARAPTAKQKAQVLYQKGRSLELADRFQEAAETFARADLADPRGSWSNAALIGEMRLHRLTGDTAKAEAAYRKIEKQRNRSVAARAALFLAVSEIVEGRSGEPWLTKTRSWGRIEAIEMSYWQGRQAELDGDHHLALRHYLDAARKDPYHPFGQAALRRSASPSLQASAQASAERFARSDRFDELYAAWLLLQEEHPERSLVEDRLRASLRADSRASTFLSLSRRDVATWPLWRNLPDRPGEKLLALGRFDDASSIVSRHFPVAETDLAFTGSLALAAAGETRRSMYIAEILAKRIPGNLPPGLLPKAYRQLLYPPRYDDLIRRETGRWGIDPHLLSAIIREESRYDPEAFSVAAARGLTQFVFPTARVVAERIELGPIKPYDLERPEIAIALGAGYLYDLDLEADGYLPQMIAGYNAGEPQAALWKRYCLSDEPEEYLSKVAFRETRGYLRKVLKSRAHYQDLYASSAGNSSSE